MNTKTGKILLTKIFDFSEPIDISVEYNLYDFNNLYNVGFGMFISSPTCIDDIKNTTYYNTLRGIYNSMGISYKDTSINDCYLSIVLDSIGGYTDNNIGESGINNFNGPKLTIRTSNYKYYNSYPINLSSFVTQLDYFNVLRYRISEHGTRIGVDYMKNTSSNVLSTSNYNQDFINLIDVKLDSTLLTTTNTSCCIGFPYALSGDSNINLQIKNIDILGKNISTF